MAAHNPIPVDEADRRLAALALPWGRETVPLDGAAGRVLDEDLVADRPFPPFDRVAMDGVAVSFAQVEAGRREFTVAGIQAAGEPPLEVAGLEDAVEVMTGAVLPRGCDTVIPVEDLERVGTRVRLGTKCHPVRGQDIHFAGSDGRVGDRLLAAGQVLHGPALAVAASLGATRLAVRGRPQIALLATGSELVDVGGHPEPHQIRVSNLSALRGGLQLSGHEPAWVGRVGDDRGTMGDRMAWLLDRHDVVVASGGISKGRFDHVPGLLQELGCELLFHGVLQRPGRPMLAARGPRGQLVLGLPGNPVSAVICLHRYLIPLLHRQEGRPDGARVVLLEKPIRWGRPLTLFLACRLSHADKGQTLALPLSGGGSGDHVHLVDSDGFLELEGGQGGREAGEAILFRSWMPR